MGLDNAGPAALLASGETEQMMSHQTQTVRAGYGWKCSDRVFKDDEYTEVTE